MDDTEGVAKAGGHTPEGGTHDYSSFARIWAEISDRLLAPRDADAVAVPDPDDPPHGRADPRRRRGPQGSRGGLTTAERLERLAQVWADGDISREAYDRMAAQLRDEGGEPR